MTNMFGMMERFKSDDATGAMLCEACLEVLGVAGVALTVVTGEGYQESVGVTSGVMAVLEELERTLGEGPGVDAYRIGIPVLEPDLASPEVARWVGFTGPAVDAGARAVFAFPLIFGAKRIGALNFCMDRPGPLTDDQHGDALVVAQVVTNALLALQSDPSPDPAADGLHDIGSYQVRVHQATGMVSARLQISVGEALARLRAHAYAAGRPLSSVAADVVDRRLRLEP